MKMLCSISAFSKQSFVDLTLKSKMSSLRQELCQNVIPEESIDLLVVHKTKLRLSEVEWSLALEEFWSMEMTPKSILAWYHLTGLHATGHTEMRTVNGPCYKQRNKAEEPLQWH